MVHALFKKQGVVEYVLHEAELFNASLPSSVSVFRTPMAVMTRFSATGEKGLVATFRNSDKSAELGFEGTFAVQVADFRDQEKHDAKARALIDVMWGVWSGAFDDEIMELCAQDLYNIAATTFLCHRHLQDSTSDIGTKYRAFVEVCHGGPISSDLGVPSFVGTSELAEDVKEEVQQVQKRLMEIRRNTVSFVKLPVIGGASGADYSRAQLEAIWNSMRLGHRYARKKDDVRAFVFPADLFPPNLVKHGASASLSDPISVDAERMKRVLDFIIQKRANTDVIILFDGRSRSCRRVMEQYEEKLSANGAHVVTECWCVFLVPSKKEDPRVPGRQTSFVSNNKEVIISAFQNRGSTKIVQRAEFNSCGESSSSSTTYTGVPMRRFSELPRMDIDTTSAILGVAASGAVKAKRVQRDIDEKGILSRTVR